MVYDGSDSRALAPEEKCMLDGVYDSGVPSDDSHLYTDEFKDLFPDIKIPHPTKDDLKWKKSIDKKFRKPAKSIHERALIKKLYSALLNEEVWRVAYALHQKRNGSNSANISFFGDMKPSPYEPTKSIYTTALDNEFSPNMYKMLFLAGGPFSPEKKHLLNEVATYPNKDIMTWVRYNPNEHKHQALVVMIKKEDIDGFDELISMGACIKSPKFALSVAVKTGNFDMVKKVTESCDPDTNALSNALYIAKDLNHEKIHEHLNQLHEKQNAGEEPTLKKRSADDGNWHIISDNSIEYIEPTGYSGTRMIYKVNFITEMVTTLAESNRGLSATPPVRFDQLQNRTMVFNAHAKMREAGYKMPDIDDIFNTAAPKGETIEVLPRTKPKRASNGA